MKTFNTYYNDRNTFQEFAISNGLDEKKNILVQIFSSIVFKNNLQDIIDDILYTLPNAKIIGSTTDGEILDDNVTTKDVVISCSVFEKSTLDTKVEFNNTNNSFELGSNIAKKLITPKTKLLILFSDGINTNGEEFLKGVESISSDVIVAGGLASDSALFEDTYVFNEKNILTKGAVGVAIDSDELQIYNEYHFGWQGAGPIMEVTNSLHNVVYTINDKPAYDIYKYYLGDNAATKLPAIGIEFPLIIKRDGLKIARAVLGANDDGSLIFAGNINIGDKVQFGFGNAELILVNSSQQSKFAGVNSIESIFVYSCMARRRFLKNNASLEFVKFTKNNKPISGFFTYGEFFKAKKCELLNQTMTLLALSENDTNSDDKSYKIECNEEIDLNTKTIMALSHLINITSNELETSNKNLQKNVNHKTKELKKKVLELEKATKAKSEFLANMSHEIRTPLNAMFGFIDIVQENEKDKQNKEYLDTIKSSADSLLHIINDILDFSKIESGIIEFESKAIDLKKLIKEISLLFYEKAKEKDIKIKLVFDKNIPDFVKLDPTRFKQIALNLISNAIKFTQKDGKVELNIGFDTKRSIMIFKVKDTGIGIDANNIKKIFKPFTQEDESTTRKFGGTGLGLSISRELAKLMGGDIKVESTLKVGSTFILELPIDIVSTIEKNSSKQNDKEQLKENFKKFNLLLVEDNISNQKFMGVLLSRLNISFDLASDGIEALELYKQNSYNTILMDENMPNMNGIEATRQIRKIEKKNSTKHTPIIALTANAIKGDKERFLDIGMDEYLAKPLNITKLVDILKKYI
ncbi:MAG: ATP-binding protein [Campylobacterota bacterium]|nr:ATP-binding protein [Campylobacterota bacterium]